MISLQATIQGNKVLLNGLQHMQVETPKAIDRGLMRIAKGVYREADNWLKGPGGAGKKARADYVGFTKGQWVGGSYSAEAVFFRNYHTAGAYPVPIRMGNLRNKLDWLRPGASKTADRVTFSAGEHEVIVYDSAEYADAIHEGKGSSAKFGKRQFLNDGFKKFNESVGADKTIDGEVADEIKKSGLS